MSEKEINLLDLILILWKKKWIIFFSTVFALVLMYIYQINQKAPKTIAKIEINHIPYFEETKYINYNSFVKSLKLHSMVSRNYQIKNKLNLSENEVNDIKKKNILDDKIIVVQKNILDNEIIVVPRSVIDELSINNVDKNFLFKLFVDQISQKSFLINDLEDFTKMSSNLQLLKIREDKLDKFFIEIEIDNKDKRKLMDYLNFFENAINTKIQKNLNVMFNNYTSFIDEVNEIRIEHLTNTISYALDDEKQYIKRRIELIRADKYVERLQKKYDESPLSNPSEFYAARLSRDSINYESPNQNKLKFMILAGLFGLLLGIFISLISNAIANRT